MPTAVIQRLLPAPSPLRPLSVDGWLLGGCAALMALGLVMISSASADMAAASEGSPYYYLSRQCLHLVAGLCACTFFLLVPLKFWQNRRTGWTLLALALLALLALLLLAKPVNGAQRWFDLGFFRVQPTELVKLLVIIYLAGYLHERSANLQKRWQGMLIPILCLLPLAGLITLQPDFGSAVLLAAVTAVMLLLAGLKLRHLAALSLIVIPLLAALLAAEPYRLERLMHAFSPEADPTGGGYQLTQALIAFARGGWFGVGLGNSVQKQYYLPEAHTDFIFAVLAEEFGLVGSVLCLALFVFVFVRALAIAIRAERARWSFAAYLAYGLAFLWAAQVLVNLAVNTGVAPTKGLALPFVSYGGSALLGCCASLGLLLRIDWECRQLPAGCYQESIEEAQEEQQPDWLRGMSA